MADRKYNYAHQQLRKKWKARIDAGEIVHCHRCGKVITPTAKWHLDHHDDGSGSSPSCASCNVATSKIHKERADRLQRELNGEPSYTWF